MGGGVKVGPIEARQASWIGFIKSCWFFSNFSAQMLSSAQRKLC